MANTDSPTLSVNCVESQLNAFYFGGVGGWIRKTTDRDLTWLIFKNHLNSLIGEVTGGGLPSWNWGCIGLTIARGTHGQCVYALIETSGGGIFHSNDDGATWMLAGTGERTPGRLWHLCEGDAGRDNPDIVYLPNVSTNRSMYAGKTFTAIRGALGGVTKLFELIADLATWRLLNGLMPWSKT